MPNWTRSMQQTFEYYIVDPGTWGDIRKLKTVTASTIDWDAEADTLGSATLDLTGKLKECYVRIYLVTIQNGVTEKRPLGTFLVQRPNRTFDGRNNKYSMDGYTPLIELKEKSPPIGYYVAKKTKIMQTVSNLTEDYLRAPVVKCTNDDQKLYSDFVASSNDTWLSFLKDLASNAKYEFDMDERGRVLFNPVKDTSALQPVWTFDDGNSSILYPDISIDNDIYNIPNVVEVIYSKGNDYYYAKAVNNDKNSAVSTVNRGREITYRVTDPDMIGDPTNKQIQVYAKQLLKELSSIEHTITYKHGYYPVRVGDCVRLNYEKANIKGVKAKIISQSIKCEPGCMVTEKAVYTERLWEG